MQVFIVRVDKLEFHGIVIKEPESLTYKGDLFKLGASFPQQHRQIAIDLAKQRLANKKFCILLESDHLLTFYYQQVSSSEPDVVPTKPGKNNSQDLPQQTTHNDFLSNPDSQQHETPMSSNTSTWMSNLIDQTAHTQNLQDTLNVTAADVCSLLQMDRVSICQLQPDDQVQVIAEVHNNRLPSLLSACFSVDTLVSHPRELLLQSRVGTMLNLESNTLFQIPPLNSNLESFQISTTQYLPEGSHTAQRLTEMGVTTHIVIPIFHHETVWGLLIAHHSEVKLLSARKLEGLRMVVDRLSFDIARDILHIQAQIRIEQESILNRMISLLQSTATPDFQTALESIIATFQGSGGRLCMSNQVRHSPTQDFTTCLATSSRELKVYTCGVQPISSTTTNAKLMEQYDLWQDHYSSGQYPIWAISNLYQTPELQPLFDVFRPTSIRSLLMMPLVYRQQLLGYLSIFGNSDAAQSTQIEPVDPEHFDHKEVWNNLELAQKLGQQFAMAIYEHELSQQLQSSNAHLNTERQQHTAQLQQVEQQQKGLSDVLAKIKAATDPETIFQTTTKELCCLLQAERVAVYQFNDDWGGKFIHDFEYVSPNWQRLSKLGANTVWNDTYLQETQGGRYRHNETYVVDDIYRAKLASCHVEILEQFQIKAFATVPVFIGKQLWGVLAAYQHSLPRHWLTTDVLFLSQTATALGFALQQADID